MGTLLQDVRFSLRMLRKSSGFTITAVLALALTIGANAVVFSVMNALILRPLNVPQAESLYGIERGSDKSALQSYPAYLDLRDRNRSFDDLAAYDVAKVGLDTGENPSRAWVYIASGNYFDALGIQPYLGHFFHGSDEHGLNSAPYMVFTYAYWHSHFQDDRGVGTRSQIANFWFSRTAPRNSCDQGAGFHRISGNFPRSAGIGRCCSSYGGAGGTGYVDSSATRAVD